MGFSGGRRDGDAEAATAEAEALLLSLSAPPEKKIPEDSFHLAYIVYFTLGAGFVLPWNAFITAVDYFAYIYPDTSVDRVFALVYMPIGLVSLLLVVGWAHKSSSYLRINIGLALFFLALPVVPVMDAVYIKGRVGLYDGYYITVAAVALSAVADALVEGGVIGSAGELPSRYMQANCAGTGASASALSQVRPFYTVKCNPEPSLLSALAVLGVGFDCTNRAKIEAVMAVGGSADQIVYANPCSQPM